MTTSRTRTSAELQHIPVADTMDFISGDAVIWGKVPKWKRDDDGQWVQNGTRHQWIARFLRGPDGEHIHFYCATIEEARKIYVEGFLTHRKDMLARINACVSMSFGLQSEWMKPVVVFLDPPNAKKTTKPWVFVKPYDYEDKHGNLNRFRGPYGLQVEAFDSNPGPRIYLQGRYVDPSEVSDLQIDTTLNDAELSYVEKVAGRADKIAWANAVRAGELPGFYDPYTG